MNQQPQSMIGSNLVAGKWESGQGKNWERKSPGDGSSVWQGNWSSIEQAEAAIAAARSAFPEWAETPLDDRLAVCKRYAAILSEKQEELASLIAVETGKPFWEAKTEVAASIGKVANSIDALMKRRWTTTEQLGDFMAVTRFRPHGVLFVIGPFNFPSHVPGGHIIPALLAGNTVVFKPSEWVSATGQWLIQAWCDAGIPPGVINLLHGGSEVAIAVTEHDDVDGVLFTGSARVGCEIHKMFAGKPQKVLALELGGNNPLVIHDSSDLRAAAITTILSAFTTSGQRCTCTRRLIVSGKKAHDEVVEHLQAMIPQIKIGLPLDEDQPFMGPLIHEKAAQQMLDSQTTLLETGAKSIVPVQRDDRSPALLRPGMMTIPRSTQLEDCEHFGPLLMVQLADDLDEAISMASSTEFGLSAGFIGDHVKNFHYFLHRVRAGVVNWNRQTTGASGKLPFGGIGLSGNHNPSGFFAADYCSYPVASLESHELSEASKTVPGLPFTE